MEVHDFLKLFGNNYLKKLETDVRSMTMRIKSQKNFFFLTANLFTTIA